MASLLMRAGDTGKRSYFGDGVLLVFLLVQVCDGAFTYVGVHTFGPSIEANPIIVWYIAAVGMGAALLAMKLLAVTCGAILHLCARHVTVGLLTILYLFVAVWPWTHLLTSTHPW